MSNRLGYESQCVAPSLSSHVPETYGHQAAIYFILHMRIGFSMYVSVLAGIWQDICTSWSADYVGGVQVINLMTLHAWFILKS